MRTCETLLPAPVDATPVKRLAYLAMDPRIQGALAAAREILDVEVACATRHTDGEQILEAVDGDGSSFGIAPGDRFALKDTYCRRVLAGDLPALVADARGEPVAAAVPLTDAAGVGAVASVPLVLSDGRLYGTLCCASHHSQPYWRARDVQFLHVLARIVVDHIERDLLEAERRRAAARSIAVDALLSAIAARDGYTGEHSRAVVAHAVGTARTLRLSEAEVVDVQHVALLHDVGKVGVPDAILRKPGPLSRDEWKIMRQHPVTAERIVAANPSLAHLAPAIRAEHEHVDGGGYPDGLVGEAIPIASRIVLVCDAYDAMTSYRPYRRAMSRDVAVEELLRGAGTQFDAAVVGAFVTMLDHG